MSRMPRRSRTNAEIDVVVGSVERARRFVDAFCPRASARGPRRTMWWRHKLVVENGRVTVRLFIDEYVARNNTEYDLVRFATEAASRSGVQLFSADLVKPGIVTLDD